MYKKTITYTDYFDNQRTEDFYFNLSPSEVLEMETSVNGGFSTLLSTIINALDAPTIVKIFKELILKAYGEKSEDGRRFIKSKELSKAFSETPAYDILYIQLSLEADEAANFVNGIMPPDSEMAKIREKLEKNIENKEPQAQ